MQKKIQNSNYLRGGQSNNNKETGQTNQTNQNGQTNQTNQTNQNGQTNQTNQNKQTNGNGNTSSNTGPSSATTTTTIPTSSYENKQQPFQSGPLTSNTSLFTIGVGEILYHGSDDPVAFNSNGWIIGNQPIIKLTNDWDTATAMISDCVGHPKGVIHQFKVKMPIDRIYFLHPTQMLNLSIDDIKSKYCQSSPIGERINGVGYNYDIRSDSNQKQTKTLYLCDNNRFLDYMGLTRCLDGVSKNFMGNFETYMASNK